MTAPSLTTADRRHLRQVWNELNRTERCDDPTCTLDTAGCDCRSSEVVMSSIGYVEVWQDGEVTGYGRTLHSFGAE